MAKATSITLRDRRRVPARVADAYDAIVQGTVPVDGEALNVLHANGWIYCPPRYALVCHAGRPKHPG